MKQRDLLKRIAQAAQRHGVTWYLQREGAGHSIYRLGSTMVPVPRHTELGERLAVQVFKECESELGEKWWR